ncbi:MAG TPA: hypothetical protein VEI02_00595 [Planctomycetota bacterium]|nr:hypothetical protein [Planctomycetota bacterium]
MNKVLIGGVLGGVLMFVWGAVAHMVLSLGHVGYSELSTTQEAALLGALAVAPPEAGLYMYPTMDTTNTPEARARNEERVKSHPRGIFSYTPKDPAFGMGGILGKEFATNVLCGLLIAVVLALGAVRSVGNRILVGTLIGAYAAVAVSFSFSIFYGFPTAFSGASLLFEAVGGLVAAVPPALMIKPRG